MVEVQSLRALILAAFADVPPPPAWCLVGSLEGAEPEYLEREFKLVPDWRSLEPQFLDSTPDGLSSALAFFSDEAFRYYLPAYLLAALDGKLVLADPIYYLTHGLESHSRHELISPGRYGARTWLHAAHHRFSVFNPAQRAAIAEFLTFMQSSPDTLPKESAEIQEALDVYWREKAG